jgi:uncharacterized protein YecE (DUF72 family)
MPARILIGTQGWKVGSWIGPFYPHGTRSRDFLEVYSRAFPTVEVGSTAFSIPAEPAVQEWVEGVPEGFVFALKVPQQVTHERRLADTELVIRRFLDRVSGLGERLGPLLLQMSPAFRPSDASLDLLRGFLSELPEGFRWAIEFRHPGWLAPQTMEVLRRHRVACAMVDARWTPREMANELALEPTADFAYLRWEGTGRRLTDYSRAQLDREQEFERWEQVVRLLRSRVDMIFGYFDDTFQGHAPHSARAMQERLHLPVVRPSALREQAELF